MLKPLPDVRKRQRSEPSHLTPKKRRLSDSQPQAAFWDRLSKIWLTKRALRELDRRNSQSTQVLFDSSHERARRQPASRDFLAQSDRSCQITQDAADYIRYCGPKVLKDIRRFTRRGGPDLSDLRNARHRRGKTAG